MEKQADMQVVGIVETGGKAGNEKEIGVSTETNDKNIVFRIKPMKTTKFASKPKSASNVAGENRRKHRNKDNRES